MFTATEVYYTTDFKRISLRRIISFQERKDNLWFFLNIKSHNKGTKVNVKRWEGKVKITAATVFISFCTNFLVPLLLEVLLIYFLYLWPARKFLLLNNGLESIQLYPQIIQFTASRRMISSDLVVKKQNDSDWCSNSSLLFHSPSLYYSGTVQGQHFLTTGS